VKPGDGSDSIRRSVIVPVENNHCARHNAVNHRRNADESEHGGKHRKATRRDKPSRKQAEATKEGNPTSSTQLPRIVASRPLHGMKIASWLSIQELRAFRCRPTARTKHRYRATGAQGATTLESDAEPPVTTRPAILVGLRLIRTASLTRTLIDRTCSPPALSDFLEPTSQLTRLTLGFGCHRSHLLKDGCADTMPARNEASNAFARVLGAPSL
jgi:hypothetical protein